MESLDKLKQEYNLKKPKINERLGDFQKFFNEPYSWFYSNNEMKLVEVEKPDDHRLFEEMCFCILTANTSAEMGMRSIDAIRNVLINGSPAEMAKRLEGIYRFSNVRPEYIVHARNYLNSSINFKIKEKLLSFRDKNELRDFIVENIKGIAYKEASHFLRNIGFKGYAILDKHIINSLFEFGMIEKPERPKNRKEYLEMEQKFREFSEKAGIGMDEMDLLLWSRKNGKILK
ncbi:N-glycosylase/DNA lyase [Candidatus Woesearchaeota archaeon]|nr:N-glycosylase/DNA lyase [Candidatus Woesearchaeota archaeon]